MQKFFLVLSIVFCLSLFGSSAFSSDDTTDYPNLTGYTPAGWSDSIVVSSSKGSYEGEDTFATDDTLYLNFSFYNNGDEAISSIFEVDLYVDDEYITTWSYDSLSTGSSYAQSVTDYPLGSFATGSHTVEVQVDTSDVIDESSESDNTLSFSFEVENDIFKKLTIHDYDVINTTNKSNYFDLYLFITFDGKTDSTLADKFWFEIEDGYNPNRGAVQYGNGVKYIGVADITEEDGTVKETSLYKISFGIREDLYDSHRYYFENGLLRIWSSETGESKDLEDVFDSFHVYGTAFDVAKHAWQFENGDWDPPILGFIFQDSDEFYNIGDIVDNYLSWFDRRSFWKSFGKNGFWIFDEKIGGGCAGLALSAIANFVHRDEDSAWGTNGASAITPSDFDASIKSRWDDENNQCVGDDKPFETDTLYDDPETYDVNTEWTVQSAAKIMYYHVAQPSFSGTNWVGQDTYTEISESTQDSIIENQLKQGKPFFFAFYLQNNGGHAIVATQMFNWIKDGKSTKRYMLWDNNQAYPYWLAGVYPYKIWTVKNSSDYSESFANNNANTIYQASNDLSLQGYFETDANYLLRELPLHLAISDDSQNIYDSQGTTKSMATDKHKDKRSDLTVDCQSFDHIAMDIIGGKISQVWDGIGQKIIATETRKTEKGKSTFVSNSNGSYNELYLPVNDQFSVEILPRDGADKIKIFVKVPYEDGSVEMFNYEEIDSAWHQGQAFTLNIGRNLSDAAINFSNGLTYSPDDRGSFNAKIPSPKNVIGLNQKDGVALRWTKPDYPALAGIKIVRKEGKFPTSIDDGTIVYQGAGNSFKDLLKPQEKGTLFFYSMVAVGADGRISELVHTPVNTGRYALTGQVAFPETMDHQMIHIILKTYAGKVVKTSGVSEDGFFVIPNIIPDEYILECQSGDSTISGTQKYGEKLVMETQTVSVKQGNAQAYFNID